ncbi:hypothetical protein [Shewanella algae]|uniref:hypothetical protein n=1 Tax=Shewanella algae TaxID=38313 RepID=UPI000D14FEEC|nr:hypothetical protein [Shewanella algae]PST67107.1 hypothetical protein AYI77_10165 [Shewanella algae]
MNKEKTNNQNPFKILVKFPYRDNPNKSTRSCGIIVDDTDGELITPNLYTLQANSFAELVDLLISEGVMSHQAYPTKDRAPAFLPFSFKPLSNKSIKLKKPGIGDPEGVKLVSKCKANISKYHFVALDYDCPEQLPGSGRPITPEQVHQHLNNRGLAHVIYSTASHSNDAPRFRVIIPLASPVTMAFWDVRRQQLKQKFAIALKGVTDTLDPASFDGAREFAAPTMPTTEGIKPVFIQNTDGGSFNLAVEIPNKDPEPVAVTSSKEYSADATAHYHQQRDRIQAQACFTSGDRDRALHNLALRLRAYHAPEQEIRQRLEQVIARFPSDKQDKDPAHIAANAVKQVTNFKPAVDPEFQRDFVTNAPSLIYNRIREAAETTKTDTVITCTPGAGKTYQAARYAVDAALAGSKTAFVVRSHAEANALAATLAQLTAGKDLTIKVAMRLADGCTNGREYQRRAAASRRRIDITTVDDLVETNHLGSAARFCRSECPHAGRCPYSQDRTGVEDIVIYMHAHLWSGVGGHDLFLVNEAERVIVDESPLNNAIESGHWSLSELQDGILSSDETVNALLVDLFNKGVSDASGVASVVAEHKSPTLRRSLFRAANHQLLKDLGQIMKTGRGLNSIWSEADQLKWSRVKPLHPVWRRKQIIHLDATADHDIADRLFGRQFSFTRVDVESGLGVTVNQVTDHAFGRSFWNENPTADAAFKKWADSLPGSTGVIWTKADAEENVEGRPVWYGAQRGSNRYEDVDNLVIQGSYIANPFAVIVATRALYADEPDLTFDKEARTVGGRGIYSRYVQPVDPRYRAVERQFNEAEMTQAVGRARLIQRGHSIDGIKPAKGGCTVWIFSNRILDVTVDNVLQLADVPGLDLAVAVDEVKQVADVNSGFGRFATAIAAAVAEKGSLQWKPKAIKNACSSISDRVWKDNKDQINQLAAFGLELFVKPGSQKGREQTWVRLIAK